MDVSRSVLVQRHGFKKNVVSIGLSSDFISLIDDFVDGLSNFKSVRIHVFANFAFESLPVERSHILVLSAWWFFLLLCEDPTLQALKMDQTHCSFALASHNKWV